MAYFNNYSLEMQIYAIIHGSYGLFWYMKHLAMPDATFERTMSIGSTFVLWATLLGPYCVPSILLASGQCDKTVKEDWILNDKVILTANQRLMGALLVYIIGVTVTIAADIQKNTHLKHVKTRPLLITDGMNARTRSPNYLGEILLYGAFAAVTNHPTSYYIVGFAWLTIFPMRIAQKEMSLRLKAGWKEYAHQSNMLIPKVFGLSDIKLMVILIAAVIGYSLI